MTWAHVQPTDHPLLFLMLTRIQLAKAETASADGVCLDPGHGRSPGCTCRVPQSLGTLVSHRLAGHSGKVGGGVPEMLEKGRQLPRQMALTPGWV